MIIMKLKGGLGNQLFQYAAGRAIAERTHMKLKLDVSSYQSDLLRDYRLGNYDVASEIATREEIESLNPSKANYLRWVLRRLRWIFEPIHRRSYFKERGFPFNPEVLRIDQPAYLNGYWQSEKYFVAIRDILLRELTPRAMLNSASAAAARAMQASSSVSLHIRRGDYIANPGAHQIHGVVPLEYYGAAVEHIAARVADPHFFIFSDDMAWVQDNLRIGFPMTYVGAEQRNQDYDDLRLMSYCHHHIVANSSFSWWGAWLNPRTDKIVVAPQKWFAAPIDVRDLTPAGWIRL